MRVQFVLVLLGQIIGGGTVVEPALLSAWAGGVLLVIFAGGVLLAWRHRDDGQLLSASLPWILFGLYGLVNALLICAGRMQRSFEPALAERYGTLTQFFVLGAVPIGALVLQHAWGGVRHREWARQAASPALALLLALHVVNWVRGAQAMEDWSARMEQDRARLVFMNVVPLDSEWMLSRQTRPSTFRLAQFLAEHDRLPGVRLAQGDQIRQFQRGPALPREVARFDEAACGAGGQVRLSGVGGRSRASPADLILITAAAPGEDERIVAVTAPLVPDRSSLQPSYVRKHSRQFMAWSHVVSRSSLPAKAHTLRAYVFDDDSWMVRPMDGAHPMEAQP